MAAAAAAEQTLVGARSAMIDGCPDSNQQSSDAPKIVFPSWTGFRPPRDHQSAALAGGGGGQGGGEGARSTSPYHWLAAATLPRALEAAAAGATATLPRALEAGQSAVAGAAAAAGGRGGHLRRDSDSSRSSGTEPHSSCQQHTGGKGIPSFAPLPPRPAWHSLIAGLTRHESGKVRACDPPT